MSDTIEDVLKCNRIFVGLIDNESPVKTGTLNIGGNAYAWGNNPNFQLGFHTYQSRGTVASPLPVLANDKIGGVCGTAYDGEYYGYGYYAYGVALEDFQEHQHGTEFRIAVSGIGEDLPTDRFKVMADGAYVNVGGTWKKVLTET